MQDDTATLEVGFNINFGDSFGALKSLDDILGETAAAAVREFNRIKQASTGMLNLAGQTVEVQTFANATTQAGATAAAAFKKATSAGEAMSRQMEYQIQTFGMSRAAARAYFAQLNGNTELADKLRVQEATLIGLREKATTGLHAMTGATGRSSIAQMEMMHVTRGMTDQIAAGASPMAALAMHMGMLGQVAAESGASLGRFGAIMAGPWGIAITAGVSILAMLAAGHHKASSAEDDQAKAAKELKQAIDQLHDSSVREAQSAYASAQASIASAEGYRTRALEARKAAVAELQLARSQAVGATATANAGGGPAGFSSFEIGKAAVAEAQARQIDKRIADLNGQIEKASGTIRLQHGRIIAGQIEDQLDGSTRAASKFARTQDALNGRLDKGSISLAAYAQQLKSARVLQDRETDAAKEAAKDPRGHHLRQDHSGERRAATLAREASAAEAQIKNLYKLADAYKVSDAAALVAEARVKAESEAIKKRGDVEAAVSRQVGLAIAQRVADSEKSAAAMRAQTAAQSRVNAMVAAGVVPAHQAAELVKSQIDDLPLLAAIEAAQQRGLATEAKRATAALDDQRRARADNRAEQLKAQFNADMAGSRDQLAMLQAELQLVGATDTVRAHTLAVVKATQEAAAKGYTGDQAAAYVAQQVKIADQAQALTRAQIMFNESLSATANLMQAIDAQAQQLSGSLGDAFGGIGKGVGDALTALTNYGAAQARLDEQRHTDQLKYAGNEKAMADAEILYAKHSSVIRQQAMMQTIGGLKSLFKEHSAGYRAMSAIEKAYAIFQAVETAASIARDVMKTASSLFNSGMRTTGNTAEGGSKMFAQLGIYAFPVVAAMVAVLAALGAKGHGGGGGVVPMSSEDLQAAAGAGTVLGSPKEKSASIAHSLELVAANTNSDLQYSNQMLIALRSIDTSIGAMAASVAKQFNVAGSLFDTSGLKLGSSGSGGFLGLFASSTTRTLFDSGVKLAATTVGDIIANGIAGSTYQIVEQVKKTSGFLGIGGGTKTSYVTTTGGLPGDITSAVQDVIVALRNGLVSAAGVIGIQGADALINGFTVSIGTVSFKDMSGQQIEEQLNAIFSSIGDQMAAAVFPALKSMQQVGEGLFETFVRVAKEYETVDVELQSIGRTFGAVGVNSIGARDALVQLFGGLDKFVTATDAFRTKFLSEAEQIAPVQQAVFAELQRLGITGVTTRDQFKNIVLGLDLTTDAGRQLYASLLAVAPAFDKVLSYYDNASKATNDGLQSTADKFNAFADALKKYRATLFDTGATQAATTAMLRERFAATSALSGTGDAAALGNLQNDAKAYLDSVKLTASSPLEYQRALAAVAAGVDKGIFAATETADYAQLQLDALKNANSILQQISDNTAGISSALTPPPAPPTTSPTAPVATGPEAAATQADIDQLRSDTNAGLLAVAQNTGATTRLLRRWDGDGLLTRTDLA